MKKLLLLCACLWALVLPLRVVATGPPDMVVVRIEDVGGNVTAIITRGEGKSEKVTFKSNGTDKRLIEGSEGYYKLISQLYQEGYKLQSTLNNSIYTTLLFVKVS